MRRAKRILVLSLAAGMPCILTASPPQTPIFTTNPSSQTVASGGTATFTASASGSPTYQWYFAFNGVTNLIGTGSSVSVTSAYANEGSYFCVASNSYGATTSSVASLGVQYAWSEYGYSGGWQYYTVPAGVTNLAVDAVGAGGGTGGSDASVGGYQGGERIWFWGDATVTAGGTVTIGLGYTGGAGGSSVGCAGGGAGGYSPWGGVYGGSGGNAGCTGTSGGGGGGGGLSLVQFPSSLSYPDLVLGGGGGGGGGGITGANGSSSGGYNSGDLPSSSGYYASPYSGGGGGGSSGDGGGGGGAGAGIWGQVGGGSFGTGDHIGGGGSGGYSFEPDNLVPAGNSWNHSYYNYGASSGVCAFRPAPLARISMPGATVSVLSGQSLSLTAQFFTQDAVEYVEWYRNGSYYASTSASSLGNYAYASTLAFGTGYANGDVWTVQIETYLESYWGENIYSIAMSTPSSVNVLYPASITSEPGNQTAISTSNVVFSVTAGGMAPLSYQWSYDGAQVVGATNASFSLTGIRMGNAGSYTVVVSNSVGSVTSTVALLTVNRATPVISAWPGASGIVYPEALSASALNGGSASVGGTFAFTAPSATPPVGVYSASITFAPSDTTNYNSVVGAVNLAVGIGTPVVTAWPAATGITFGQSLSASTLSGGTASAGGTFAFATSGATPGAGTYYASVIFTPTIAASYTTVTGTVAVAVSKAASSVTVWPVASGITYGQKLSASTLGSGTATPAGAFAFATPLTTPNAGPYTAAVTFTPSDSADYTAANGTASVTVSKAVPSITAWPGASDTVYGQPLAASILSGGSASTDGLFTFDSPTNVPNAGTNNAAVTFTPADTADFNTVGGTVSVTVAQAAQVITLQLQVSNSIPLNQFTNVPVMAAASSGLPVVLSLGTDSVAALDGTGTNLVSIGESGTMVLFADQAGDSNYLAAAEVEGTFDVTMMNQTITFSAVPPQVTTNLTWPLSATSDSGLAVVFNVVSGPATLDSTGTNLAFNGAGSVVVQASQPGDGDTYNAAVPVMQAIQVSLAQSSITWSALPVSTFGDAPITMDGASSSGDPVTYTSWDTNVALVQSNVISIVGAGMAVISLQDAGDPFYAPDTAQQVLTVNPATPALTLPTASSINFGQSLASSTLSNGGAILGTNVVTGSFSFADPSTVPNSGVCVASVVFTPSDTTDYNSVLTNVNVVVVQLTPAIVNLPSAAPITFGQSLAASALIDGNASVSGSFAFADNTVIPGSAGDYGAAVNFIPSDTNYSSVSTNVEVEVNLATPSISSWPSATPYNYGSPLSVSSLVGGSATPAGIFTFNAPAEILNVGVNYVSVEFTPNDTADYVAVAGTAAVQVAQGLVEITLLPAASPITYGQSLAASILSGGNATVGGSFAFVNSSVIPGSAGTYSAAVSYTPTNSNYPVLTTNVAVAVNKAAATVVLSDTNQNYTGTPRIVTTTTTPAGLTVNLTYNDSSTPPVTAGAYTLAATIEDTNYAGSATGTLLVGKVSLLVAAQNETRRYGVTNALFTATVNGFADGETLSNLSGALTFTVEDTNNTPVLVDTNTAAGTYSIIPGGLTSSNYAISYTNGILLILPAILTVSADNLTNVYGSPMPPLTWSYQGFVNGEGTNALRGAPSLSTNLSSGSPVAGSPYTITISNGTLSATNYSFTFTNGTFTVLPASLIVSADNKTNVYGSTMPALTGSMVGVTNDDPLSVTFTTIATQGSNVGSYDILPLFNDPGLLANYTVTTNKGTFTVTPAPLLVTANNQSRDYGYANPALTLTYNGFANGDDSTTLSTAPTASTTATLTSLVGSYPITVGGGVSGNYTFTYVNGTLSVTKAPLTVVGNNASRPYGAANPVFTAAISGVMNGDNITARFSTSAVTNSAPGQYIIQLSLNDPSGKLGQYNTTINSGILTVSGATLIGAVQDAARAYGQTNPVFTVSYGGFVNNQDASLMSGSMIFACTDTNGANVDTNSPVGVYPIVVISGQTAPNYIIQYTNGTLTVTQAVLTVAANATNRVYGAANPVFTDTITGYVNGEDSNVLSGALTLTTAAGVTNPVGTYSIIPAGVSATNYSISFTDGVLTVTPAPLSVSAGNASRLYGQANPLFSGSVIGLANDDNLGITYTTAATPASSIGTYSIVPAFGDPNNKLGNYALTANDGTLTVGQTPLSVVAASQTRAYGQSNPTLTGSLTGVVNDDSITASYSTTATTESLVGSYSIVPSINDPQTKLPNYSVSSTDGTLTVTQAVLTVSANHQSRLYGVTNPVLTVTYSGFANGEGANVISGQPALSTAASLSSPIGNYDIVVEPGSLSATNYSFSLTNGTLTVGKALLTVTADDLTRLYGQTNPVLTVHYSGFVDNDTQSVLSGATALSTVAGTNTPVGAYDIVAAAGNLNATNYALSFVNGTLTINAAPLSITATDATRQYGATNPVFAATMQGFVDGQNATALAGTLSITTSASQTTPVGTYAIIPSGLSSTNYLLSYTNGVLTVTQAPLTVTANSTNRIYGQANPPLTGTHSGTLNGDDLGLSFVTTATSGSPVGQYAITPTFADAANKLGDYLVTTNAGALTVTPALLSVTAQDQTRAYGQPNPALTVAYGGFASGDSPTNLIAQPVASTAAGAVSLIGPYTITASGGVSSNYTFNYISGTLTVTQANLTIIGDNAARAYGQSNPVFTSTITGVVNGDNLTVSYETAATAASLPGGYEIVLQINDPNGKLGEYNLTLVSGLLTVTNGALIITVDNQSRLYGQTNPPFTAHYSGFVNGQGTNTLSGALTFSCLNGASAQVGTNTTVGNYSITATGLTGTNYTIQFVPGTLGIGKAALTVTGANAQRLYGAANPSFTAAISGFANGQTAGVLGGTLSVTSTGVATSPTGSYPISPTGLTSPNYSMNYVNGTLTINAASLTGSVQNAERAYGQTNPVFSVIYSGFVNGQDSNLVAGPLVFTCMDTNSTPVNTNTPVGVYPIHVITPQTATNYSISYVDATLTITQAVLTVSADNQSRLYGVTNPVLTVTYSGFANGEGANVISGQPALSTAASLSSPVGNYDIVVEPGSLSATNYSFSLTNGTLTVGKALLTVTADDLTRLYGQTNPVLTVHYSGFVDNDTQSVLSGAATLSTIADTNTPVGAYNIMAAAGNLNATNYALSFVNGTLTIDAASLTGSVQNAERAYGQTNPVFSVIYSGFANGQDSNLVAGPLVFTCMDTNSTPVNTNTPVGVYPIHVITPQTATNYSISYVDATLTITQAVLTVSADNQSRLYGVTNPVLTVTYSGFANGEGANVISGQPALSTAASLSSPVGNYDIVVEPGSLSATNYSFSLTNGTLTVGKALLTVTADDLTRLYGQTNPVLTVHYSGFVDNDTQSVLSGATALSTVAGTNTPVGAYDIVAAAGNLNATNYALSFVNGTLTINAAPLSITATDATRQYGATNPVFAATMQGFVNGQGASALAGTLSITTSASQTTPVGAYAIIPSGLSSTNYLLSYSNGVLTCTQAPLNVAANSAIRQYGTPNPVFGGTINGLLNGDPITVQYNCVATQSSPAGSYAIVPSLNDPDSKAANYAVAIQNGTLTITVALIPTPAPVLYVVGNPPVFIDTNASVADGGGLNFSGALLTLTIITNANAGDELAVESQGNAAGQIGAQATNVTYGGAPLATFTGGANLNPLVFLFNTNANAQSVTALMRQLTFATDNTGTNYRVIQTALTVGDNTVVAQYVVTLDRPPVASNDVVTAAQGQTIQIIFSQVLTNVYDADGHALTIADFSDLSANGGRVSTNDTSFTYVPPSGLTSQDRFAYIVADGHGGECVGIIIINFMSTNSLKITASAGERTGAKLTMAGVPNQTYLIQASTNLVNWTTLNTVTADPEGIIEFLDSAAMDYHYRFYRAEAQ